MRKFLLFLSAITFTFTAAHAYIPEGILANSNQTYNQYPILQCPASNEVMKDFRNKLAELKKSIKAEAQCEPIKANVENLSNLVTQGRDNFLRLTAKGQTQGLSAEDLKLVENYASEVTTTVSAVFDVITGNDACFAEDKQGASLSFITGLIGESAKILSLVGGPMSGTVSIAANVITGFLKGMDQIQKTKIGYKFDNVDQRMAYANTLCSFFEYRRELDALLYPYDSISTLENLKIIIDRQLVELYSSCAECALVIDKVNAKIQSGDSSPDALWSDAFEKEVITDAEAIDKIYERKLGTHTYRSLQTRSWIPLRVQALQNTQLRADLGLQDVMTQMFDIEGFLLNKQVQPFLDRLIHEANIWRGHLLDQVFRGHELLADMEQPFVGAEEWMPAHYPVLTFFEMQSHSGIDDSYAGGDDLYEYIKNVMDSLEAAQSKVDRNGKTKISTYFKRLDDINRSLKISVDLMDNYCTFFGLANWYLSPEVSDRCESRRMEVMRKDVAMMTSLSPTATANFSATPLPAQISNTEISASADLPENEREVPVVQEIGQTVQATTEDATVENIAPNWVDSLIKSIDSMGNDPHYFDRQIEAPVVPEIAP